MQFFYYQVVKSTQDLAKEYLIKQKEAAAFIARGQSAGYGKSGRDFYSPENKGLYLSVALPDFTLKKIKQNLLTPAIAVEVVKVLKQNFSRRNFQVKWVNDVYLNGKKVAGILTENTLYGLVVGIGINVAIQDFPEDLKQKAGSIQVNFDFKELGSQVINAILEATKTYQTGAFLPMYRKFSNLIGKKITLKLGKQVVRGRVIDFDDQGRIVLEAQHRRFSYGSGEVTKVEI